MHYRINEKIRNKKNKVAKKMKGKFESKMKVKTRYYVFLIFSTEEEIENLDKVAERILKGESKGFKLERIAVLKNPPILP